MKTQPVPTPLTMPYWEGCRQAELRIQYCPGCDHYQFYPRSVCTECLGGVEWVTACGQGKVATFTVVRHPIAEAYAAEVPYVIALVELSEGPRLMSQIDCDLDAVEIGMPVEVFFEPWSEDFLLPKFRPSADAG